jgi:glycosyltransferase involved in cell wall biosynthesis
VAARTMGKSSAQRREEQHASVGSGAVRRQPEQRLRVLVIVDDLRVSGAQRQIAEEARVLDRDRVALSIVALAAPPGPSLAPHIAASGVPIGVLPGTGILDPRRLARLVRLMRRMRPDVVHTQLSYANILGLLAARLAGRPSVASLQNVTTNQGRLNGPKRALERLALRLAQRTIVVAEGAREETQRSFRLPPERIAVLPNAIDPARLELPADFDRDEMRRRLGGSASGPLICVIARLTPDKGHGLLLQAAATLASRHPGARYLFVGTGTEEGRLRQLAHDLGLSGSVAFLGVRDDVPQIVAASDLFVLPSLNEGLSLAMLEAMAIGTPVVVTRVGGSADVIESGQTGWIVPPGQPAALVDAIGEALGDPDRAVAQARRARDRVRNTFAVERHVEQLEAMYRDVLGHTSTNGPL